MTKARKDTIGVGERICPFCHHNTLAVFIERTYLKSGKVKSAIMKTERCIYPCLAGGYEDKLTPEQAINIIENVK